MISNLSTRERLLVVAAVGVIGIVGYALFRHRTTPFHTAFTDTISETQAENEEKQSQITEVHKEISKLSRMPEVREDPAVLATELGRVEAARDAELAALDELRKNFVPDDRTDAIQQVKVRLSELAKSSGVLIQESSPYQSTKQRRPVPTSDQPTASNGPFLRSDLLEEVYQGQLHKLSMASTFGGLRKFLDGLHHLDWSVTIVHFEIKASDLNRARAGQPLETILILAM